MKKYILSIWETVNNIYKHRRHFVGFLFHEKGKLIRTLKDNGFRKIRPYKMSLWKLQYNICYFRADFLNSAGQRRPVFIKVSGPTTKDCFENEITVNKYIKNCSPFLYERSPELLLSLIAEDFYILAFEFIDISPVSVCADAVKEINLVLREFEKCGLIHTDFRRVNVGRIKESGEYCFFDYGTTLCPESNHVRIRNSQFYNYIDAKPDDISLATAYTDFYYDDATHMQMPGLIPNGNYIAGGAMGYYAKMGSKIYRYSIQRRPESTVEILHREDL